MYIYIRKKPQTSIGNRYEFKIRVNNEIYCKPIFIRGDFISQSTANKLGRDQALSRPVLL